MCLCWCISGCMHISVSIHVCGRQHGRVPDAGGATLHSEVRAGWFAGTEGHENTRSARQLHTEKQTKRLWVLFRFQLRIEKKDVHTGKIPTETNNWSIHYLNNVEKMYQWEGGFVFSYLFLNWIFFMNASGQRWRCIHTHTNNILSSWRSPL